MNENSSLVDIAVVADTADCVILAKQLAADYSLTWVSTENSQLLSRFAYQLRVSNESRALVTSNGSHGPISISFTHGRAAHRRRFGGGKNQPLGRAIGVAKNKINYVFDTTAGFGADAFVLASLGCTVTLVERNPALAALLSHAITEARGDPSTADIAQRMNLVHADAAIWLLDAGDVRRADTIYLDPMYPGGSKRALAKKNMQILQALAGPDTDSGHLLNAALSTAKKRVVVKRPKGADNLIGRAPDTSIASSKTRYDIYLINP